MLASYGKSPFALALLATTMLTQPGPARAAPGDALGDEFLVNSATAGSQSAPSVAVDDDGDFAVAWHNFYLTIDSIDLFARRFDAAGGPRGPEFPINSFTTNRQWFASVAMDTDGDFVVVWTSRGQDDPADISASGYGVFAQRYDAAGVPQGSEFQVNDFTTGPQNSPSVAMALDGDFVVAWESGGQDGSAEGVFAQRFDAAGNPAGGEFQVNSFTTADQSSPSVAMDADGDFVVAWQSDGQDGDSRGVFAQRFDAAGVAQGSEFQVNTFTTRFQGQVATAMDADGDFVVAWTSYGQDGFSNGVFARRFDAAGAAQGLEFQVNTVSTRSQSDPSVAMDADGDFVVAWAGEGSGDGNGVFARRFDGAGNPLDEEFRLNDFTTGTQSNSSVALDADGDFVVAWTSDGQDGDGAGVFAQRFQGEGPVAGDFTVDRRADILWRNGDTGNAILWQMDGFATETTGGIGGASTDWQVRGLADFDADTKTDILWRNTASGAAVIWLMDGFTKRAVGAIGGAGPDWRVAGAGDFDGDDHADILWRNTANGANAIWKIDGLSVSDTGSIGGVPSVWEVAGLGTFDSDARSDILWRNAETGGTVIWKMSGLAREDAQSIGAPKLVWRIDGVGDGDGDKRSDILWRNTGNGATLVWRMDGFVVDALGGLGPVPLVWEVQ
jgi:hypothetical protein